MAEPTGKPLGRFTALLVWLSGHSARLTAEVPPAEQVKIAALGMTLILPVGIAATGAFATAYRVSQQSVGGAAMAAAVVGSFTLILDRALIASFSRNLASLGFRTLLTFITSTVFAHTALLWLFSDKITEQAERQRQAELETITARFDPGEHSEPFGLSTQRESLTAQMDTLLAELKHSSGLLEKTSTELARFRQKYNDEIEGNGASKVAGDGPEAKRLLRVHIEPLEQDLAYYQGERQRLQNELSAIRRELTTLHQAQQNDPNRARTQAQLDQLTQEALNRSYLGVLTQFVLLHEVMEEDATALVAYVLVSLLLLFWELIPVLLKFTGEPGEYEHRIQAQKHLSEAELNASTELAESRARLLQAHALRIKTMEIEEMEAERWLKQAEARFELVQKRRASIPRRATKEQREAYLTALNVLVDSLTRTGKQLREDGSASTERQ